jgi:tetratricopeptide (TPR) repeat protein
MYLADMVFEGPEEELEIQKTSRGLQAIMGGAFSKNSQQDRQRALLHLSQVIDLQTKSHYAQASKELKMAIDAGLEHPAAYYDLGYLYNETEHLQSATKMLRNAVTHTDFAIGARLLLGEIYAKMGQYRQAATDYLEALKLADAKTVHPKQINYLYQMYESIIEENRRQKDDDKQQRLCENVEGLLNQPDWFERIRGARKQMSSTDQNGYPLPLAEMLTEASSSGIIESMSKIYALANTGNPRSAMEEAYFALDEAPYYLPLHQYMAKLLVEQDEIEAAVEKLKIVGRTYAIRGDTNKAIELYRDIIEIAPLEFSAREDLINQLIAKDEIEDAIYECTEMAEMYYSLADLENAREAYTKALPLSQNSRVDRSLQVKLLKRISDIDQQNLNWDQALMINERIRRLTLDDEETRYNLIEINLKLGKEEQAVAELDDYLSFLLRSKKREQAIEFLENLTLNNPGEIPFRRRLADLYKKTGRISDTIEQLDAIGEILLEKGNKNGAIQVIESILKLEPPNKEDYQALLVSIRSDKI